MKQALIALLCLAAIHAFTEDSPDPKKLFEALSKEASEKIWKQPDEWREKHPGQKAFEDWQHARVEQWGMDILKRYTDLLKRYPDTPYIWQHKQSAEGLWWNLQRLNKPEYQKYLDDWKVMWPGDNVIERRFYTSRLDELAKQFPDMADAEKIARTLMAEYPLRREPYRALLSMMRRKSPEAYATALQEILKSNTAPEKIKTYLQGKTEDEKKAKKDGVLDEDEPYNYWGRREKGDKEIDHYEIREAQLDARSPRYRNKPEEEEKKARTLIAEFPAQTRPYSMLFWLAGKQEEDLGAARSWLLEFVKGPAPDAVKAELSDNFFSVQLSRQCYENFSQAMYTDNLPKAGEAKAWLEKHEPLWRTYLEAYADFVEGRLTCEKTDEVNPDAVRLLTQLSHVTADPDYRRHLAELNAKWLPLPVWSEEERVALRRIQLCAQEADVSGHVIAEALINHPALNVYPPDVCEKATRTLMKEFPAQAETYKDILILAGRKGPLARALLQEILDSPAPAGVKKEVQNEIGQMNRIGQPIELKGVAVDGREIDVQRMKGKVVLIDFWATWCGPCLGEVPRMKSLYEKFHAQGFEIIGLSLDEEQEALKAFLAKDPTPWPQHWLKSWSRFGINSIPTMWLIDKKGIVRDVKARKDLEQKVAKWLAEP
jgi:thiol-disulfide isomerase/thioredoxin